jgi:hypothetical protein
MATFLYSRDSKDKVRVLIVKTVKFDDHWEIHRETGLLEGKLTLQPVLTISAGKVNRNMQQQTELEFKSIVNKQRDKGYKSFQELFQGEDTTDIDPMDHTLIDSLLPKGKTYAGGQRKLMLAKDPKTAKNFKWDKEWWTSRKLDGIRAGVYYDEQGNLTAISRNGKSMNPAFEKIFKSKKWKTFFKKLENGNDSDAGDSIMVDGELYIHGKPLAVLSGLSQKNEYEEARHGELEFWIFDFADSTRNAEERAILLNSLQEHFDTDVDNIRINPQVKLSTYDSVKKIHDLYIIDGYEGAICRDASRLYGFGSRDDRMVKVKEFQDDEFEIIGMSDGLRPEDMVFKCLTHEDKVFECKPMGTRELKFQYIRDIDNIIGKKLTVKFFNYTEDGIPFLPVGKAIRDYE